MKAKAWGMGETRAVHSYAKALLEVAEERSLLDQIREDMRRLLPEVLREVARIMDEREGIVVAEVRAARPFTPDQEERLMQKLSAHSSGRRVRLKVESTRD